VETEKYCQLIQNKNQIDEFRIRDKGYLWNKWSKLSNPYEKIGSFSNLNTDLSISRAFYKLYEILVYYDFKNINNSLHICEAPGGFIRASLYVFPEIKWYAQTLYEGGGSLTIDKSLDKNRWIHNGDGDLYKLENILSLKSKTRELGEPNGFDLITGDGGFDVSNDPNNQEQLSLKLIFGEMLTALHCQKIDGNFICKIFDSMTKPTYQLLLILKKYYKTVNLIKPRTSRYTNSEKYIVAQNFIGISEPELSELNNILVNWDQQFCRDLGINYKKHKYKDFVTYNTFLANNQAWYIHQAVYYSKTSDRNVSDKMESIQNKRALVFCLAFDLIQPDSTDSNGSTGCQHKRSIYNEIHKCQECLLTIVKV
jgi:23S rRNA U2552 (ribose-2'-O)-methylase RlmE/FtsJ